MPRPKRKRRPTQDVLAIRLWEEIARNPNCGFGYRIFCINAIAVATKVIEMELVLPGVPRKPKGRPDLTQASQLEPEPEETLDENAEATKMLEELNAANPQSDRRTDQSVL
jgi:hypothetical protein